MPSPLPQPIVQSGGRVNLQKAAEILIYEFRQGLLGRTTLETPAQYLPWVAAAQAAAEPADEAEDAED